MSNTRFKLATAIAAAVPVATLTAQASLHGEVSAFHTKSASGMAHK